MRVVLSLVIVSLTAIGCITVNPPPPNPPAPQPSGAASAPQPPPTAPTLVIDRVVMNKTPQSGTWLYCFTASTPGGAEATFNESDKEYSGDGTSIKMDLRLDPVSKGDVITYRVRLDDDQADVCAGQAEDQAEGSFSASSKGSAPGSKGNNWSWVVYWHLEQ